MVLTNINMKNPVDIAEAGSVQGIQTTYRTV
jgi:hypothetical protein